MKRSLHLTLALALALLLLPAVHLAAQTGGEITGLVTDASGAALAGATVIVTNKATGAARRITTNNDGLYAFPALLPGQYDLKIEQQGFKTAVRDNITLEIQQAIRLDVQMEVGQLGETVTVTATGTLLNAENTTVGTVIENKRIVDLPLNGRNFLQLVATAPNVSYGFQQAGQAGSRQGGTRSSQQISVAGQRSYFNRFTIDGVENTDVNFNTPIILPSIDALQEFKVQTGVFPAEFGRASTQINISTKSGSRDYHATLFEFIRNDVLDARSYDFTGVRAKNSPKEPFKWNQYGFTLGGPVWLPKKFFGPIGYDNRERIFFMTNFEGYKDRKVLRGRYNLPAAAMYNGDFSKLLDPTFTGNANSGKQLVSNGVGVVDALGRPVVVGAIYDPATRRQVNGRWVADQFAGNIIPVGRIAPLSKKLLEFYPVPTLNPNALGTNHEQLNRRLIDKDQFIARGDFIESGNSSWAGRYSWGDEGQVDPGIKLNGTKLITQVKQIMASNTRTFASNKVNEARFGYNYFFNSVGRELAGTRDVVTELAIPGVASTPAVAWGIPSIGIQNFSGFGDDTEGPYANTNRTFQLIDNFNWTVGNKTFRFGGELRWDQYNQIGNQFARGGFAYEANATTQNGLAGTTAVNGTQGYGFADYLLGYCKRCEVAVALATVEYRASSQYYYMDYNWKLTPKLTINAGLRYEYTPPWFDKSGRVVNAYLPFLDNTPNVADKSRHPVLVRIGKGDFYEGIALRFNPDIQVARDGRLGERLVASDKNDFAPRLGVAWNPTSKWTVRFGGGMFYSQDTGNPRFDMARNLSGRRRDEATPDLIDLTWASPFRNLGGTVQINNPFVLANNFNRRTPYALQYLLNVQRELRNNLLLEVGYLGSVSRKLESLRAFNESIPGATGSVLSRAPYPEFSRIQVVDGSGRANYNGLSVKLEQRLHNGLSFVSGYTFSKSIDNASAIRSHNGDTLFPQNSYNLNAERALSSFDVRHRMVNSVLYQIPFGKGRRFLDHGGVANAIIGGWELGTLLNIQSGFPLTLVSGKDQANTGGGFDRPNQVASGNIQIDGANANKWFNTALFALQPFGTFGNVGRNTLISPGIIQWDASLLKTFHFTERVGFQFRFEAFNAANHLNLGNPDVSVTSSNFGKITGGRGNMRELQFGGKLFF
ncbi:MAG: carboxypeptidase-like regulatory domain-containing protein [Blastocatellia bacterium]